MYFFNCALKFFGFFLHIITLKLSPLLEILANIHNLSGLIYHACTKRIENFANLLYTVCCNKLGSDSSGSWLASSMVRQSCMMLYAISQLNGEKQNKCVIFSPTSSDNNKVLDHL